jgi:hypothetical protein
MAQIEIQEPVPILDNNGRPVHPGWARFPYFQYLPESVIVPRRRVSEADRYIIFSPTHLFAMEIMDTGYLGYVSVYLASLRDKKLFSHTFNSLFPLGVFGMPPSSDTGSIRLHRKKQIFDFIAMKSGARIVKLDVPEFDHHRMLRGEVVLLPPPNAESLVTVMPWRRDNEAFRYNRHSPWFSVEGVIQFGITEIAFTKGNAWGIFDWCRGVRPDSDTRYWAAACGMSNGKLVGINVGYDSSDSEQGTGNAFFVDGKIYKLDQVTFHISPTNWLSPWRFTSNDNRLEMTFSPEMVWDERKRMLLYSSRRKQLYGTFAGTAALGDGSAIDFKLTGFAERKKFRF